MDLMTARLELHGIHAISDVDRLQMALLDISGVLEASVDLETLQAYVVFDASQVSLKEIEEMVAFLGYSAAPLWVHHGAI